MPTQNLLEDWYKEALIISSPLNITPLIERKKVDFIYQTLSGLLGNSFFKVATNQDKAIAKISWLFSLLSNYKNRSCIHALYDISRLIKYAEVLDQSIRKDLSDLKKNPENLRTFFFELFIYRLLDNNNVPNIKKPVINGQTLEGICKILGEEYLFECRKMFLPKINDLDIMRRLMMDIYKQGQKMKAGVGMILSISLRRPINGVHRENFAKKIQEYFKALNNIKTAVTIRYNLEDEFGSFSAIDYNEASLIEIKSKKNYDVLYYVKPPDMPIPDIPNFYQARIACNFSILESKIYKKLEDILKEKAAQHRNSPIKNKIIFLDSEMLPEFHMNLFQNEGMYHPEKVKSIYEKLNLKDILCVVRRKYSDKGIHVLVDTFCSEASKPVADYIKSLFKNCFTKISALSY
jgi:hypothetical protein